MFDRSALTVLLLAGCNQIYGLDDTKLRPLEAGVGVDLDLDGIPDDFDACLAPMRDADDDLDVDMILAANDPCPFDADSSGDTDGDKLHDVCDPFPTTLGDRQRCYMSFGSTDLNTRLWKARETTNDWSSREGELYSKTVGTISGLVSTIDLAPGVQTTLDAIVTLNNGATLGPYAFRLWARAADTFDNKELGCELSGDAMSIRIAVVRGNDMDVSGGSTTAFLTFPKSMPVRIRMTQASSGTGMDVRCVFSWDTIEGRVKAHIAEMPPGRVAFGTENLQTSISALAIYERDTIEPLP